MNDLLTELEKSAIPCENGTVKWISILDHETRKIGCNISLSHGMSSITTFLIRLYQMNFETKRVDSLLRKTVTYILDQVTYAEGSISYFPTYSKESSAGNHYSRLGWCYGDWGVAYALWRAAITFNNTEWENTAIQILIHNSQRRDLQINAIRDAGLCHGSAGVAYIFWTLYLKTRKQEFWETAEYWLDITMKMAKYEDGLAGYKAYRTEEHGGPEKSEVLLDGIAGIGLALLSYLSCNEIAWDECLMLS